MNRPYIIDTPDHGPALRGEVRTHRALSQREIEYLRASVAPIRDRNKAKYYEDAYRELIATQRREAFVAWFKRINYRTPLLMLTASAVLIVAMQFVRWAVVS